MTVSSEVNSVSYSGNGSTQIFAVPYYFLADSHLRVILRAADGTETVQAITTNYTVSGAGNQAGGQVTMLVAPATGVTLVILRNVPATQETDYVANDPFPAESHERALDKLTMLVQQGVFEYGRALRVPDSDPEPNRLAPADQRANLLLGFDALGQPITVAPVSGSASDLATNLANNADPAKGASLVGYKGRTVAQRLGDFVSVKDYGAKGDSVTNDAPAIQAAINAVITAGGGTVYFPAGTYKVNTSIIINYSANSARFAGKVHLRGASSTSTCIFNTGAFGTLEVVGSLSSFETYIDISNLCLSGSGRVSGSRGLRTTNSVAYMTLRDVIIEDFEYGWVAQDTEQLGIYDSFIRYNEYGVLGLPAAVTTSANSWSFYNTVLAGNIKWGMYITNANALNWNGGSVQYNGYIGDGASAWGIKIIEAGDGYGTIGFTNMIFEGNGGIADFVSVQDTNSCAVNFNNVSFVRTVNFASATVTGAANNGSGAIRLTLNSTAPLVGRSAVQITGVVGTTEANSAQPWPFTIVNGTQIDLVGSTFTNAYVSGGIATIVGYGRNCVLAAGTNAASTYTLTGCTFKSSVSYLPAANRPTIAIDNLSAKIRDDGTNVFQHAIEKLTYIHTQQIGDDGSAWAVVPTTVTAAGGTFTATGALRVKKIGKTVHFDLDALTTSWAATPTAPISFTVPFQAVARTTFSGVNNTTLVSLFTVVPGSSSTVVVYGQNGTFPVTANGQRVIVSGTYETNA